jgi:hypothetical protein
MVDRPQEQHGVDCRVAEVELAGVAHRGVDAREVGGVGSELVDVERHQVAVLDAVAALGQPQRVASRATADIGDHRGRRRQVPQHDLFGALELDHAARLGEAVPLATQRVVGVQGGVVRVVHDQPRCHSVLGSVPTACPAKPRSGLGAGTFSAPSGRRERGCGLGTGVIRRTRHPGWALCRHDLVTGLRPGRRGGRRRALRQHPLNDDTEHRVAPPAVVSELTA